MKVGKLYLLEARLEVLAESRRGRSESYRSHIAHSKVLRGEATSVAHPDYQVMPLADLLACSVDELNRAGVDEKRLRRAGVERHLAEAVQRGDPRDEAEFVALSVLVPRLREYAEGVC